MKQTTLTAAGTNCLTQAEDAVKDALGRSAAWRELAAPYGVATPLTEAEGLQRVWIDHLEGPGDGMAFTTEELEGGGTLAMVTADPESSFALYHGEGEGVVTSQSLVMAVLEMNLAVRERAEPVNHYRRFKNALIAIVREVDATLLTAKGPRWLQSIEVVQSPLEMVEVEQEEVVGRRLVAAFLVTVGPGEGG